MAIRKLNPTTPGRRGMTVLDKSEITRQSPQRSLTWGKRASGARNNQGRTTVRFRGGGARRRFREIDFLRDKDGIPARVASIEYDPNRSARIALLNYADGEKRYILAPVGLNVGDTVLTGKDADFKPGHVMEVGRIPAGVAIHNIELTPGRGAVLVRGAGSAAEVLAKEGDYAHVRLPSKEVRMISLRCRATIGQVGNLDHDRVSLGKAGRGRHLGRRPHNRGVVMNPVDHPMGGGEGRASGGHPQSPWGQPAKGYKTRDKRKTTSRFIIQRRVKK
ncbi:MAG: 50S ribosomal protein L2 [Lentisphaerae bacterium ADurb.BinA184]|nr:MAG: 50S ribosomal protein L2 [Lentisphaerae bacterium ADurb.BinA184]